MGRRGGGGGRGVYGSVHDCASFMIIALPQSCDSHWFPSPIVCAGGVLTDGMPPPLHFVYYFWEKGKDEVCTTSQYSSVSAIAVEHLLLTALIGS